jgi:ADP-ribose pyrophosphatase YjhB (NUDIX family)
MAKRFNVRVYGILMHQGAVLISDEYIRKNRISKFPGGGLEFGEGTIECLCREFREELALKVEVTSHFYTTDFYVASSFDTNSQVISIYYMVKPTGKMNFPTSITPHNYEAREGAQSLRWIPLSQLKETDLSLVIDRKVCEMLLNKFTNQEANV